MSSFRDVECSRCHNTFNYLYEGGRPKAICPKCKSWKKKKRKSLNAYDETTVFCEVPVPKPWNLTKNGKGNITRWFRGRSITIYDHHNFFAVVVQPKGSGRGDFRYSQIRTTCENIPAAISWAQNATASLLQSYSCR